MKSEIVGTTVEYATGDKLGKVRDILVDTTGAKWPVVGLVVGSQASTREHLLTPSAKVSVVEKAGKRRVVVTGHAEMKPITHRASSRDRMRLSHLDRADVKGDDDKSVGRLYDVVLRLSTDPWRVDRLLVRPKGVKGRRLRVAPQHVAAVRRKEVVLSMSAEEAQEKAGHTAAAA
ncbi:MAG TPA: PRC-barrel domain-containing protein [Candidatus Thermoplasmatota archaeon]